MKKLWTLALALMLVLCLCACNQTPATEPVITEFSFPEGTAILGINISGMDREAGWNSLQSAVDNHSMALSVDGIEANIAAAEIDLGCSKERYDAIADALEAGAAPETTGLISFNEGKLRALLNQHFNKDVTEASIVYDESSDTYILLPDAAGQNSNPNALVAALRDGIFQLQTRQELTNASQLLEPSVRADDEEVQQALETVNKMSSVDLTYSFTADGKTSTLQIPAEKIRSFISLGPDNVSPTVNRSSVEGYVSELSDTYSAGNTTGSFIATGGSTVGLTVTYNGTYLNQDEMVEDLVTCITEGTSGERTAPFVVSAIRDMPYGGTYIEVNLSSQHLWFYKNGSLILSTSLVSGKVATGHNTPNGVFSIYSKEKGVYLVGEDYRTFVNYWMPFYGGYGLHDATWRGSFGGDIYLYNGSHGCVNLPLGSAASIYNNVSVGTKVIVYGGRSSVPPQTQSLSGTTSYSVADDEGTITLNIQPRYGSPTMTYTSSNSSVASVDGSGVVTINGIGTATITVSVPASGSYSSATTTVTISVHSACDDGRHQWGSASTVKEATCQPGKESVTCTRSGCGYTTERETDPVLSHSYGDWSQTIPPTCGAAGLEERLCSSCEIAKETRPVDPTGEHTTGTTTTTKAPTCSSKGTTETRCAVCTTVITTGELDIDPDAHTAGDAQVTDATCTVDGVRKIHCKDCGALMSSETIPAGHRYGDWAVTSQPTCTGDGVKTRTCSGCSGTETGSVSATGHSFSGGVCGNCSAPDPNYTPPSQENNGTGTE